MKQALSVCVLCLCALLALTACGASVPEGMSEDQVQEAAEATVQQLEDEDYTALMDSMTQKMQQAVTQEEWEATWAPVHSQLGAMEKIGSHNLAAKDGMAVDVVKVTYENGSLTFTLSYDPDYQLAGLYMK